jgi:Zn-dependent peptidase ImmA (M78 family)
MIHLLESKGIRVYFIAEDYKNVDAFSVWDENTPLILLNTFKSSERSRFDAAHELGHLVLHKHGVPRSKKAEQDANSFAAEFLMPRTNILAQAPKIPDFNSLMYVVVKNMI